MTIKSMENYREMSGQWPENDQKMTRTNGNLLEKLSDTCDALADTRDTLADTRERVYIN